MNIFTDVLFLFVYIMALLYFRIPDVTNNNYLSHKFYLFIGIFGFYYVVQLIKKIKNGCKINPYEILQQSLSMSLYVVIGYSIYVDLLYMDWSKGKFCDINTVNPNRRFLTISLIIVVFVTLIQLTRMLFQTQLDDCSNKEI